MEIQLLHSILVYKRSLQHGTTRKKNMHALRSENIFRRSHIIIQMSEKRTQDTDI